jgi:hypothetical protein
MEEVKKQGMESLFVPYEIALELKELGFDEPCFAYFYHHQEYKILFDNPNQARDYNSIKIDVGSIFDHDKEKVKKGLESLGDSVSRLTSVPLYQQAFRWLYKQLGRDGFGVMPIDTDKCNEELRKLIEIVKEITPHNHE